jgi:hypothetical protein
VCRGCCNQLFLRDEFHRGGIAGLLGKSAGVTTRRAFMAYSVAATSALTGVGPVPAFAADEGADLILRGGTVRPLPGEPISSAIAVKHGKVLAVGDEGALSGLKTGDTKIVDLAGRTLLPGLIDPHFHTILASLIFELLNDVGYAKYPTREKLVAHLKEVAASAPKGQWVVGSNFDNLLQGGDFTRGELDAISTDYPIFVWYTNGHDACVNSAALRVAGISEDVGELPGGGHFGRGPDGKLDGMVYEESAMLKFAVHGDQGRNSPPMATRCCHRQDAEGRGPRRPVARSADRRRRASLRLGSGATGRTHQRAARLDTIPYAPTRAGNILSKFDRNASQLWAWRARTLTSHGLVLAHEPLLGKGLLKPLVHCYA